MPTIKHAEEWVYQAVQSGDLEIDEAGQIWRVAKRQWSRWDRKAVSRPCTRKRAEHDTGPYLSVSARIGGRRMSTQASRLVYRHFYGPIPGLLTVNHKNGKKKDNHPENLELATYTEQILHALHVLKVGRTDQNGERNAMHKLTIDQVREIRALRDEILAEMSTRHGTKISSLAQRMGVSYQTVWDVLVGRRWASVN